MGADDQQFNPSRRARLRKVVRLLLPTRLEVLVGRRVQRPAAGQVTQHPSLWITWRHVVRRLDRVADDRLWCVEVKLKTPRSALIAVPLVPRLLPILHQIFLEFEPGTAAANIV